METNDKSLLRCTIKKSADVFWKLVLYASYVIVSITGIAFALYGAIGIWSLSEAPLKVVIAFLVSIPWYYYAGAIALLAIPVYSFLWCVARELTEEDWNSDTAENFAIAIAFAITFAIAIAFAFAIAIAIAFAFAIAIAFAFGFALESKALLFFGACLHYLRRMKGKVE